MKVPVNSPCCEPRKWFGPVAICPLKQRELDFRLRRCYGAHVDIPLWELRHMGPGDVASIDPAQFISGNIIDIGISQAG